MSVDFGRLDRTFKALNIGQVKGAAQRQRQRDLEGLLEYEDQFKIGVSGRGEEFPEWTSVRLKFNINFVDATAQRDMPYDRPHFTYGVFIERGGPVGLMACVTEWWTNNRNETLGCTLAIGAVATDVARTFQGELHARFQGYGAPVEQYGDPTQFDIG
jgi:hypothetical protein